MTDRPTLTATLDQAHGALDGALSRLAAAARDALVGLDGADLEWEANRLATAHAKVDAMASLLAARAREDLAAAVLPGQSYEARLSGTPAVAVDPDDPAAGTVTLTSADRIADRLHRVPDRGDTWRLEGEGISSPTYVRVVGALTDTAAQLATVAAAAPTCRRAIAAMDVASSRLVDLHADITPTGEPCTTVARDPATGRLVECDRVAVRRGRCAKCWPHVRAGIPPDAAMLREWNGQLERDCSCEAARCGHAHAPGRCLNRIKPGEKKRVCNTCQNRADRERRAEREEHR